MRLPALLAALALVPAFGPGAAAQGPPAEAPAGTGGDPQADRPAPTPSEVAGRPVLSLALEEGRARSLNNWYEESEHWALRGIVLTSYGPLWHPAGASSVAAALLSKEPELHAFAVEALLATAPDHAPRVMTTEVVDALVRKALAWDDGPLLDGAVAALERGLPGVASERPSDYKRWWREAKADWQPPAWVLPPPPEEPPAEVTSAGSFIARAFDLSTAGMELALVIDTTGSMQLTIDASAAALVDITRVLEGIAPKLRIGLVEYKDAGDMSGGGARVVEQLTDKPERVRGRLAKLVASGGGDVPEAVLAGLRTALGDEMRWRREANKLLVVIGDAPAHPSERAELLALAEEAHRSPFGADASEILEVDEGGESRGRRGVRPFIISALGVGDQKVPGTTRADLTALAAAGGGAYAEVLVSPAKGAAPPSQAIVLHVLTLAFGSRWKAQLDDFLAIYLRYRDAGCFD